MLLSFTWAAICCCSDFVIISAELPDRSIAAATLLPLNTKDREGRTKEENYKLLNGNSGDPADWVWLNILFVLFLLFPFHVMSLSLWSGTSYNMVIFHLLSEAENSNKWQDQWWGQYTPCRLCHEWCIDKIAPFLHCTKFGSAAAILLPLEDLVVAWKY